VEVKPTKALAVSTSLSLLFLIVYGGCNWITAHRTHVGTVFFWWEIAIPFVPFFILPYLSIDLFFIGAPFLCRTNRELNTLRKRIATAIVAAGICFLLFPLRFAFPRPPAAGWLGVMFDWFRGMDPPFNLVPSLHAALMLILADVYNRHSRGAVRAAIITWFILIAVSPILTYQHHLIDIAAGFVLAGVCLRIFRDPDLSSLRSNTVSHNPVSPL
jgi:membrane-associated phospholipid phosphatase